MTAIPKDIEAKAFEIAAKIPSTEAARPFIASLIAEAIRHEREKCLEGVKAAFAIAADADFIPGRPRR